MKTSSNLRYGDTASANPLHSDSAIEHLPAPNLAAEDSELPTFLSPVANKVAIRFRSIGYTVPIHSIDEPSITLSHTAILWKESRKPNTYRSVLGNVPAGFRQQSTK